MIRAQHRHWADIIFQPYLRRLFKRNFHEIRLFGTPPEIADHLPLLLLPNHSTWWDGFFVYLLNKRVFHRAAHLMMLEAQLTRYKFFAKIGAYSIEPENPSGVIESLEYTLELLSKERTLVAIFPQGELLPWHTRPLGYKRGVEWILRKHGKPVTLLPLAIRTEFLGEKRPSVFFLFGDAYAFDPATFQGTDSLEKTQTELLNNLASRILQQEEGQNLL